MVKRCFIEDCYTGKDKENGPAIFFKVPKHRLEEWRDSSRLCCRHFDEEDIIKGPTRQQNNRHPALEDLPRNGPVKKKKLQPRCKTITSILGTPISSIVQNQLTTIHRTDCRNSSQPITKSLCTNVLSDSGSSHVMFDEDTIMDSVPVPVTSALPDPGPSQATVEDDIIMDSVPVPVTSALPDPGSSQAIVEDDTLIDSVPVPVTSALPDPGSSQATVEDDTIMVSVPVPVTSALPDPGSSQAIVEDNTLIDSVPVPVTSALPDPGSSQAIVEDNTLIDSVPVPVTSTLPGISKHYTRM
ncbi:hypothetical protein DAPPUDRAFT_323781 [Daphnia pulex]|uniref:Uncharacterized protein n=1 Tax=Daphnia pulex TaxID=6669 RepID=E9GZR8_DAPPU|nr:hypothetical protein DAPPUDRAFT_323781 [Daphnia pulex]|eukprot:EFX75042.1 hypothetical protein DAPPUDRAFT_323781 [Daphnia pulex]